MSCDEEINFSFAVGSSPVSLYFHFDVCPGLDFPSSQYFGLNVQGHCKSMHIQINIRNQNLASLV